MTQSMSIRTGRIRTGRTFVELLAYDSKLVAGSPPAKRKAIGKGPADMP